MKILEYSFVMIVFVALSISATMRAGDDNYCAKLKDGVIVVSKGESPIVSDAVLANGTRVQTNGVVVKKDGSKITLKDGECVDKEGNLVDTRTKKEGEK